MPRAIGLVVPPLLAALAGCLDLVDGPPVACDPPAEPSRNAPPLALTRDPQTFASRFADSIGEGPVSATGPDGPWTTRGGRITLSDDVIVFDTGPGWPSEDLYEIQVFLTSMLDRLYGQPDQFRIEVRKGAIGSIVQRYAGQDLMPANEIVLDGLLQSADLTQLTVPIARDFSSAGPLAPEGEVLAAASAHARCGVPQRFQVTEIQDARLSVIEDTLVDRVWVDYEPDRGHCGTNRYVHVDAVTGAYLGHSLPVCF